MYICDDFSVADEDVYLKGFAMLFKIDDSNSVEVMAAKKQKQIQNIKETNKQTNKQTKKQTNNKASQKLA